MEKDLSRSTVTVYRRFMAGRTKYVMALEDSRSFLEKKHEFDRVWYDIDHGTLTLRASPKTTDKDRIVAAAERFSKTPNTLGLEHECQTHFSSLMEPAELTEMAHVLRGEAIKKAVELVPELRPSPAFTWIWPGGPRPADTPT